MADQLSDTALHTGASDVTRRPLEDVERERVDTFATRGTTESSTATEEFDYEETFPAGTPR